MSLARKSVRVTAAAMALGVGGLAATPAFAADEVGHGQASAIRVQVAGMDAGDSGTFAASNDGKTETTTGNNKPALEIPTGGTVTQGTLNQDAWSRVIGDSVSSSACAGISGKGATLVAVGPSNCLSASNPPTVTLNGGQLKFSTITNPLTNNPIFAQLPADVQTQLNGLLGGLLGNPTTTQFSTAVEGAIGTLVAALGNPSLSLNAGVIQAACTATDGATNGDAQFVDAGFNLDFGTQAAALGLAPINIALPSDPAPNTPLSVGVGDLTKQVTAAVTAQLVRSAAGAGPLAVLLTPGASTLNTQGNAVVTQIVNQLTPQLAPLEDNLLKGTLNKQTSTGDSQIHVTALDLQVLPAAAQVSGSSLAALQLGDVDCLGGPATAAGTSTSTTTGSSSAVPTNIDSGLAGDQGGLPTGVLAAVGALFLVAAGGVGVRRVKLHHDKG